MIFVKQIFVKLVIKILIFCKGVKIELQSWRKRELNYKKEKL